MFLFFYEYILFITLFPILLIHYYTFILKNCGYNIIYNINKSK